MRNSILQPGLRAQVKDAFYSNWLQLLDPYNPNRRWFMTATPWHVDDLVSELRKNPSIPKPTEVWAGENFKSPCPEILGDDFFRMKFAETRSLRAYNRAFRGIALSDDETWLNPQAIKNCIDRNLKVYDVLQAKDNAYFTGVDLGHRDGEKNCPSVIFTLARTPTGRRIPVDIKISKSSNALDIARAIISTFDTFHPALMFVENNSAQTYIIDILTGLGPSGLPIEGYFTGTQKLDPNVGVPSLLAEIEVGQWTIPLGAGGEHEDDICECSFCKWIAELKSYPLSSIDTVMACWLALGALKKLMEARTGGGFSIWKYRT